MQYKQRGNLTARPTFLTANVKEDNILRTVGGLDQISISLLSIWQFFLIFGPLTSTVGHRKTKKEGLCCLNEHLSVREGGLEIPVWFLCVFVCVCCKPHHKQRSVIPCHLLMEQPQVQVFPALLLFSEHVLSRGFGTGSNQRQILGYSQAIVSPL